MINLSMSPLSMTSLLKSLVWMSSLLMNLLFMSSMLTISFGDHHVDHPFDTDGQLMFHEEMHHQMPILLKTFGSTGLCLAQHLFLYLEFPHPCVGE
jgi:hypothetical protein